MPARNLIACRVLPGLFASGAAIADEVAASTSGTETAMHGTFNNGEDLTRPILFQVIQAIGRDQVLRLLFGMGRA